MIALTKVLQWIALLLTIASAQNNNSGCYDARFATLNATGSVTFPGLQPLSSSVGFPNSNWTLNVGQKEIIFEDTNFIDQKFWLKTNPVINSSASDLKYTGCTALLFRSDLTASSSGSGKNNGCDRLYSDSCYSAIIDQINSNVSVIASNPLDPEACVKLLNTLIPPDECQSSPGFWVGWQGNQPFGNPKFGGEIDSGSCNSSQVNIFDGAATQGALQEYHSFSLPLGNQTYYDLFERTITPILMTAWPKEASTSFTPESVLVCVGTDHVEVGSRVPSGAASRAMVARVIGVMVLGLWSMRFQF